MKTEIGAARQRQPYQHQIIGSSVTLVTLIRVNS
jgi:hypothetical protein